MQQQTVVANTYTGDLSWQIYQRQCYQYWLESSKQNGDALQVDGDDDLPLQLESIARGGWTTIEFSNCYDSMELRTFAKALVKGSSVRSLAFSDVEWDMDGGDVADILYLLLGSIPTLTHLNLSGGNDFNGGDILGHALSVNVTLQYLDLSYNPLDSEGVFAILQGLSCYRTLRHLCMDGIDDIGTASVGSALGNFLDGNLSLHTLSLMGLRMERGFMSGMLAGLRNNCHLINWNLEEVSFSDADGYELAKALSLHRAIEYLHLKGTFTNNGDEVIARVLQALCVSSSLVGLDLSNNFMRSSKSVTALCTLVSKVELTSLRLRNNQFSTNDHLSMTAAIVNRKRSSSLRNLSLSNCELDLYSVHEWFGALGSSSLLSLHMNDLVFSCAQASDLFWTLLGKFLASPHHHLEELKVIVCAEDYHWSRLAYGLEHNTSLSTLALVETKAAFELGSGGGGDLSCLTQALLVNKKLKTLDLKNVPLRQEQVVSLLPVFYHNQTLRTIAIRLMGGGGEAVMENLARALKCNPCLVSLQIFSESELVSLTTVAADLLSVEQRLWTTEQLLQYWRRQRYESKLVLVMGVHNAVAASSSSSPTLSALVQDSCWDSNLLRSIWEYSGDVVFSE